EGAPELVQPRANLLPPVQRHPRHDLPHPASAGRGARRTGARPSAASPRETAPPVPSDPPSSGSVEGSESGARVTSGVHPMFRAAPGASRRASCGAGRDAELRVDVLDVAVRGLGTVHEL